MHCLVQYGKIKKKGVNEKKSFYFGKSMNIIELLEFIKDLNNQITFPYFLSMSTKKEIAEKSSKRNIHDKERIEKDLYSVILTIHNLYKNEYEPRIFEVKDLSENSNEEEYILLPFTFLELLKIKIDSEKFVANIELKIIEKKEISEYKIKEK